MKIALCSSWVPFVNGGYRNIVEWLEYHLKEAGHLVERVYMPTTDNPNLILQQLPAFRWLDLEMADRVICFRPPAHMIVHSHKILWFIHHIRSFYDLWDHDEYRGFPKNNSMNNLRRTLHSLDTKALQEARKVFTNSQTVSQRLKKYNNIKSEVLYPPILHADRFICSGYNNEIVCICRTEQHKRQHLLIEAMRYTTTDVKLRLCGMGNDSYRKELKKDIHIWKLENKILFEDRWISEQEKVDRFARCLAAAYLPIDEDSYGYPSVEASHAAKAILTTQDSGGVLELVQDGINGFVVEPTPLALAEAMDVLYKDKASTERMGANAKERLRELHISWDHVLSRLLA